MERRPILQKIEESRKIPEKVTENLLQSISKKTLKIGEELPPEKELAELLGVSRGSLRESLAIMEFLGIIENKKKRRIVVRDHVRAENLFSLIRISKKKELIYDLIEFRKVFEPFCVELACLRATNEELRDMEEGIARLEKEQDYDMILKGNETFHIGIARATHNSVLALIEELLMHVVDSFRKRVPYSSERKRQVCEEHQKLYKAISDRDGTRAKKLVLKHLLNGEKEIRGSNP
jgi:GntR family transcriptional repressor for pyruvate dehydrogenase complex